MFTIFRSAKLVVSVDDHGATISTAAGEMRASWLSLPIDGGEARCWRVIAVDDDSLLPGRIQERRIILESESVAGLRVIVVARHHPDSAVLRLRYEVDADPATSLTKVDGRDGITYLTTEMAPDTELTELQLGQYEKIAHSFIPREYAVDPADVDAGVTVIGPVVFARSAQAACLLAYEHGAQAPDAYLSFSLNPGSVEIRSAKGNYLSGQPAHGFTTVWFDLAIAQTEDDAKREFREFVRTGMSPYGASREPKLFYNTWNYQERNHWYHRTEYIEVLSEERILREIDVAHEMGVDVYVIDTGWFDRTGDWAPDKTKFPNGMILIKERLQQYGMELGLWFNPIVAAKTSSIVVSHPEQRMSKDGRLRDPTPVWGTEESYGMCLASDYGMHFAEKLVQVHRDTGVTYFKWDAIGQYGCDSAVHDHGDTTHTAQERLEAYSYQMGRRMIDIAEYVNERVPGAIVDFDITEGARFVGLGFLGAGKYFLMNNGPYFEEFDIPGERISIEPATINVFVHPGWARPRICRQAARWDYLIPSQTLLTHFLPDGSRREQGLSLDSMYVAGNGMWGDLLDLTDEQVEYWAECTRQYKAVAEAAARSYPRYKGDLGTSPEIYEKIDVETSTGFVTFFALSGGDYSYTTQALNTARTTIHNADDIVRLPNGRVRVHVTLTDEDSRTVFFTSAVQTRST